MTTAATQTPLDTAIVGLRAKLTPAAMETISGVYAFHFKDLGETHTLDAHGRDGQGWLTSAPEANKLTPNFEVTITSHDFVELIAGRLHPMAGMATGRMKLQGNFKEAIKLDRLLKS